MPSKCSLVRATAADEPRLTTFITDHLIPYEPLYVALGTDDDSMYIPLRGLAEGRTLLALDGDKLVGVAINVELTSDEYKVREEWLAESKCELCKVFLKFWTYVEKNANFWLEGETKALDLDILCVSVEARGRGIGQALIEGSRHMALQDGYSLFRMDCSSFYSARLAEAAGMSCVFSLPYDDYKNENGETAFKVEAPHKAIQIFKQRL